MKLINSLFVAIALCVSFNGKSFAEEVSPFAPGETIEYDVRKLGMKVGEVKLTFEGKTKYNNQDVLSVHFVAKGSNFSDDDKIYLDPQSFLPIMVERDVHVFGGDEKIVEKYDAKEGKVTITKTTKKSTDEKVIDKDGPLENIYGFLYRYRLQGKFDEKEKNFIRLPTKDLTVQYKGTQIIEVKGQKQTTHYLQSNPKQFRIWFDSSPAKLPVRIDGAMGFGQTSMVLKNYQP